VSKRSVTDEESVLVYDWCKGEKCGSSGNTLGLESHMACSCHLE